MVYSTRAGGEADAYNRLICAIYKMAKTKKRITVKERTIENEKFDIHLFLVSLGFVGNEYKTARRILRRNLTCNNSWKSGHRPERIEATTNDSTPTVTEISPKVTGDCNFCGSHNAHVYSI